MFERERAQEYSRQAVTAPLTAHQRSRSRVRSARGNPTGRSSLAWRAGSDLEGARRVRLGAHADRPCSLRSRATADANRFFRF